MSAPRGRLRSRREQRFIVSSLPFQLVGSFDDIDARLVVQVELDARTGEIVSISGDRDAIRKTCSFLLEAVGTQGTRHGQDHGDGNRQVHGLGAHTARGNGPLLDTATNNTEAAFVGTASTGRLSDQEVRDRARPANILAALRREREFPQAATRFVDHECERELRSTSTSPETSERDWEIPREVDRRDERTMECAPFNARQNPDARSGGNGNAAGPSPAGLTSDLHHKNTPELVSRRDAHEASAVDAFPPRSSGERHLARGFSVADDGGHRTVESGVSSPWKLDEGHLATTREETELPSLEQSITGPTMRHASSGLESTRADELQREGSESVHPSSHRIERHRAGVVRLAPRVRLAATRGHESVVDLATRGCEPGQNTDREHISRRGEVR